MRKFLIKLIEVYQCYLSFDRGVLALFAPGGACRYEVSCSEYTKKAVKSCGICKGIVMGIKRILSCR